MSKLKFYHKFLLGSAQRLCYMDRKQTAKFYATKHVIQHIALLNVSEQYNAVIELFSSNITVPKLQTL